MTVPLANGLRIKFMYIICILQTLMSAWREDISASKFARTLLDHTAVIVGMVLSLMLMEQVVMVSKNKL